MKNKLTGVFAAAATPLDADYCPALSEIPLLLDHLAAIGCDGALLLGTTGEGPSFSVDERLAIFRAAVDWRAERPGVRFTLIGGTGCASMPDTVTATAGAYELGVDATLLLPPFYYKVLAPSGLTDYFRRVADAAVPDGRQFLLYHIPPVSGVPIPIETMAALLSEYPDRFAGLKDSGTDLEHTRTLINRFPELTIFTGSDNHLLDCIEAGGAGAITALANVFGDTLAAIYTGNSTGKDVAALQAQLTALRHATGGYLLVAAVKHLLFERHGLPEWPLRPPLEPLCDTEKRELNAAIVDCLS